MRRQAAGRRQLQYAIGDPDGAVRAQCHARPGAIPRSMPQATGPEYPHRAHVAGGDAGIRSCSRTVCKPRARWCVLTDSPNAGALDLIRARALDSAQGNGRWTTLRYALPAFLLLGRVAACPTARSTHSGECDRESVIEKALALEPATRRQ